jgi:hypothetical protein
VGHPLTVAKSLFFANECFGAFADGASKPREVGSIFTGFVTNDLHRSPASRAIRQSLGSEWIKQKVQVSFHGALPVAARFITVEAPEGCLTGRGNARKASPNVASKSRHAVAVVYPPAFLVGVGIAAGVRVGMRPWCRQFDGS